MATSRGLSGGILHVDFPERPSCATSRWLLMSRSIVLCLTNPRSMLLLRRWVRWRRQGRWHWPRGRRGRWPRAPICFGSGRMFRRRWGRRFGGGHEAPIGGRFEWSRGRRRRGPRGRRGQGGRPVWRRRAQGGRRRGRRRERRERRGRRRRRRGVGETRPTGAHEKEGVAECGPGQANRALTSHERCMHRKARYPHNCMLMLMLMLFMLILMLMLLMLLLMVRSVLESISCC